MEEATIGSSKIMWRATVTKKPAKKISPPGILPESILQLAPKRIPSNITRSNTTMPVAISVATVLTETYAKRVSAIIGMRT